MYLQLQVLDRSISPAALFFLIFPKKFWREVADQTNDYELETRLARLERHRQRYSTEQHKTYRKKANCFKPFTPKEIVHFMSLLLFHASNPKKQGLKQHWSTTDKCIGLESPGTFGNLMSRNRFMDLCRYVFFIESVLCADIISRYLHFTSNMDPRAKIDRAWKVRLVSDVLQETFSKYYVPGQYVSFDEAVLPGESALHSFLMFFKDKPHKFGTKLFMLCCAKSAYCIRYHIFHIFTSLFTSFDFRVILYLHFFIFFTFLRPILRPWVFMSFCFYIFFTFSRPILRPSIFVSVYPMTSCNDSPCI